MSPAHTADRLRVVVWHSERDFASLRDRWNQIAARMAEGSVFLRHEWFDAAWQWARADAQLYMIAVLDGDTLIGIAPLVSRREPDRLRTRKLELLTVPDTQICDILAEPSRRTQVLASVLDELGRRRDWDVLELAYLAPAVAEEFVSCAAAAGRPGTVRDQGNNPGVGLAGTWEEYYARRSRRLKKGNNLIANKLKKGGHQFRLECLTAAQLDNDAELQRLTDEIVSISSRSWKRHTGLSLDHSGPNAFIRRLSALAAERGWLSVWRFEVDGQALAMEYQLTYNGWIHALRSDYDDSAADLSPGTYLNWKMLEQLFETDNTRYLMGPGENAYKLRWAEEFDPVRRVVIYSPTLRGRARALLDLHVRPAARVLRDKVTSLKAPPKESS